MNKIPPTPAPKGKSLEQQNSDFTAEGSPPPGTAGTPIPSTVTPATADRATTLSKRKSDRARTRIGVPDKSKPKLPL